MAGGISGIRAIALLAVYACLSLYAKAFGVPAWISCVVVFAAFFIWFRVWPHLFTLAVIFGMYGLVLGMPRPEAWPEAVSLVLNDTSKFSLRVLLYLIVPMIFFTSVVDPYQLARDVARLRIPGAGPVLQLIGSIRLAVFNRLREIDMLLAVRGIESASGLSRFCTVGLWTVPLLAALITEAANRSAYCQMLGLPFPPKLVTSRSALGAIDVMLFACAGGLLLFVAVYVLVTNPNAIDFGHAPLRARVEAWLQQPVTVYRPMSFVEHSGFSETVREEIAMVLANHAADEVPLRPFDEFVGAWDLAPHLDRRVLDLSGGWRKYLGLALFMNRPLKARLLLDTTSHLSDARVRTLLQHAAEGGDVVFCEYDPQLLLALSPAADAALPTLIRLADDGSAIRIS